MRTHPAALAMPELSEEAQQELTDDIKKNGLLVPIELLNGKIIDGRHRYRACKMAGVEPEYVDIELGDQSPGEYVWSMNAVRRHLTKSQRGPVGAELLPHLKKQHPPGRPANDSPNGGKNQQKVAGFQNRDRAAALVGVNRQYIQDSQRLKKESPELYHRVKKGELKITQAKQELKRETKRREHQEKAKTTKLDRKSDCKVIHGDCIEQLSKLSDVNLICTDPPYNIGIDYGSGKKADALPVDEYLEWCGQWIDLCSKALSPTGTFWLLVPSDLVEHFATGMNKCGLHRRSWVIWYETFGTNCSNNFNRTCRHLLYYVKDPKRFTFNADAVNRPSDRQTKYKDKRAQAGGKIWDDVWLIPRLTGTANERLPDFPTQLPLELVAPIIGCSSNPGDLVVDPFSGSATTGVAAKKLGRKYIGIEREEKFWEASCVRLATS